MINNNHKMEHGLSNRKQQKNASFNTLKLHIYHVEERQEDAMIKKKNVDDENNKKRPNKCNKLQNKKIIA